MFKKILAFVLSFALCTQAFASTPFLTTTVVDEHSVKKKLNKVFTTIDNRGETLETKILKFSFDKSLGDSAVSIILPTGEEVTFFKKKSKKKKGLTIWRGKDGAGNKIKLRYRNKKINGRIYFNDEYYKISDTEIGRHIIISHMDSSYIDLSNDYDKNTDTFCPDVIDHQGDRFNCEGPGGGGGSTGGGSSSGRPTNPPSTPYEIKMLVLYSNGAAARWNTNTDTERDDYAEDLVDDLNYAIFKSGLSAWVTYTLAATDHVSYNENNRSFSQHNSWVQGSSQIESARNSWGADVVALLVDDTDNGNIGGRANGIYPSNSGANFAMHVAFNYGHVFEHEMGHVAGMRHNIEEDNSSSPFSYGHGLRNDSASFRTVMSYDCSPTCNRTSSFSNPEKDYAGHTTGSYSTEDNARVMMTTADNIAAYRSPTAPYVSTWAECRHFNQVSWSVPLGSARSELKVGSSSNINSATLRYSGTGNSYFTGGSYQYAFVRNCTAGNNCTPWSSGVRTKYSSVCN